MGTLEHNLKHLAVLAMLLLSSCGGGGGGPLDVGPTPPVAGQAAIINYISATPPVITTINALTGSKIAVLRFIVKDGFGNAVNNGTAVNFVLTGPNGGEYIGPLDTTPTTASTTTLGGVAEVNLVSGKVAGVATVTASVPGTAVSTPSGAISIGGGVPAANRFRLASDKLNFSPAAIAGKTATIDAYLADRFGNVNGLVGTSVSFMAEGGAIGTSALADSAGVAEVVYMVGAGFPADGKVTIMAMTQGEDAFVDANGNGVYDIGESIANRGEPFLDLNHNGIRDASEPFFDTNGNGVYDGPNLVWNGPDCPQAGCRSPATIWTDMELTLFGDAVCQISPASFSIANAGSQTFTFIVQDVNSSSLPGGTAVNVFTTGGTLSGQTSATIPDGAPGPATLTFKLADSNPLPPIFDLPSPPGTGLCTTNCPFAATITVTVTPPAGGVLGCSSTSVGLVN